MKEINFGAVLAKYPYANDFFEINALPFPADAQTLTEYTETLSYSFLEDKGFTRAEIISKFHSFINKMEEIKNDSQFSVEKITILGGYTKTKEKENVQLTVSTGEIISIVGATGSGKSRLLADIEWLAQGDTVTGRKILINGEIPPESWRFSMENKLVAQLSQNMNFVMDVSVSDFIYFHAMSRMIDNVDEKIREIIDTANSLSGEQFANNAPLTSLSGGQSRALMVSDTAVLSRSPVVLIDEIENAGINKKKALEFLASKNKIVLIATHDPLLALSADKRIVIKNGGISKIIESKESEKETIKELSVIDEKLMALRESLRNGEILK